MSGNTPSIWDICRVCAEQMVGGPRCFKHNPTPEQREAAEAAAHAAKNRETVDRLATYLETSPAKPHRRRTHAAR